MAQTSVKMRLQALSLVLIPSLCLFTGTVARPADQKPIQDVELDGILDVRAELKKAEIIPTVIPDFLPSISLSIAWPKHHHAALGNTIKPKHVQDKPTITLHDETNDDGCETTNMTYVVTLTDPDAPSRDDPQWSEMCHWIIAGVPLGKNISSTSPTSSPGGLFTGFGIFSSKPYSKAQSSSSAHEVMEWKPPGPPPKTGKHRYVFLVFAPANGTSLPLDLSKPKERQHWGFGEKDNGVWKWAEENGLVPVGANFIYAQNKKQ